MDKRWLAAVGALSAVLGVLAMIGLAPDTAGPPEPVVAIAAAPRPVPAPPSRVRPATTSPEVRDSGQPQRKARPALREVEPPSFGPLDQLYEPTSEGLTAATFARRDSLARCWADHGGDELLGRFTLKVSVADGGDGVGDVEAEVVNPDAPQEMVDCVMDVMADAAFPTPDHVVSMVVPIPIPGN